MNDSQSQGIEDAVKSAVEGVKGKAKQVAGVLTGDENREQEGKAQQDRADALGEAAKHQAEAEKERQAAELHHARERAHQDRD